MFNLKIPLYFTILLVAGAASGAFLIGSKMFAEKVMDSDVSVAICKNSKIRLAGYKYIKPLLFTETTCESDELMGIKSEVMNVLNGYKSSGTIMVGSVYLRQLNEGEWFSIGESEKYLPGSLMKVPELITFMKMREKDPGLFERQVFYKSPIITSKSVHYFSKSIEPGNSYSVKQLLYYMIVYSDNNATALLNTMMDLKAFQKVFTDMGINAPDLAAKDIPISVADFSKFMRAIYNATYLESDDSELCAELLSQNDFKTGMRSAIPGDIPMAYKFGEAGDGKSFNFSESGIVYVNSSPYLLTVMTKGKDLSLLPDVVKSVTKKVFELLHS